jgi:hypothetical protein
MTKTYPKDFRPRRSFVESVPRVGVAEDPRVRRMRLHRVGRQRRQRVDLHLLAFVVQPWKETRGVWHRVQSVTIRSLKH